MPWWDSNGNKIGFRDALRFRAADPAGYSQAQVRGRHAAVQAVLMVPASLRPSLAIEAGTIVHGSDRYRLAGARATVATPHAIAGHVSARQLTLGPPLAPRDQPSEGDLLLLIEDADGAGFVVAIAPADQPDARDFAVRLNAAAGAGAS